MMDIEKIESLIKKGNKMVTIKRYQDGHCYFRHISNVDLWNGDF